MAHFFAYLSRMRYIKRWNIMRNTQDENIQEHSLQVAMIAQCLCKVRNKFFGGQLDEKEVLSLAIYHEAAEVITGDLATPIKYYNPEIRTAYKHVEHVASLKMLDMLPEELKPEYKPFLFPDESIEEWRIVKAADKICAYLKCIEELKAGNMEFDKAHSSILADIEKMELAEVKYFMDNFVDSFSLTLDELN